MSLNQIGDFHFKSRILNLFEVARVALSLGKYTNALKMSKDIWFTWIIQWRLSNIIGISTLRLKIFTNFILSRFSPFFKPLWCTFNRDLVPLAYLCSSFEAQNFLSQWRRRVQQTSFVYVWSTTSKWQLNESKECWFRGTLTIAI